MEDINQHFEQLRRLLVKLGYPHSVDKDRICAGITTELLPLLHFGLLSQSKPLATFILESGYDLYKKNDLRFTEGIYKLLRNEFKYNPILQCSQFLTDKGFAKRKIQFVVKCLQLGINKHNQLIKKKKLESQSKISWNKTNLAKKVENILKNNNHKKKPMQIQTKIVKKIPHKPKQIIATQIMTEEKQYNANDYDNDNENHELLLNDSLTIDEIRNDLPQPIVIKNTLQSMDSDSDNEHKNDEKEEKAMEISNEQLFEQKQQQQEDDEEEEEEEQYSDIEEVEQSMQIPQHTYDMNLIPEYDPNKYMHSIDNNNNNNENNNIENKNKNIESTEQHYSGSYLDTYSTLMDMPNNLLQHENDENNININENENENYSEQKQIETMSSQNMQSVIIGYNKNEQSEEENNNNNNDNENDEKDEYKQQQNNENENENNNNDEKEEKLPNDNNNENNNMNNAMQLIMQRLDKMENKMDQNFETINARLTLLEGKIKFIESKQISKQNNGNGMSLPSNISSNMSSSKNGTELKSSLSSIYKPILSIKSSETSKTEQKQNEYENENNNMNNMNNNNTFSQSTIGSSSLPISLTPAANINNRIHNRVHTVPIQSTLNNNFNRYPKHIHAPITPSPFISQNNHHNNIHSFGYNTQISNLYNNNNNNINNRHMNYNRIDLMRYPLSSSSSNKTDMKSNVSSGFMSVATNNQSLSVPKIQSIHMSSDSNQNSNNNSDPDNTLNFIKELKEMLRNTDELLKSKPISLYQSNI